MPAFISKAASIYLSYFYIISSCFHSHPPYFFIFHPQIIEEEKKERKKKTYNRLARKKKEKYRRALPIRFPARVWKSVSRLKTFFFQTRCVKKEKLYANLHKRSLVVFFFFFFISLFKREFFVKNSLNFFQSVEIKRVF